MTQHLPNPYRREADIVADRLAGLGAAVDWPAAARTARPWVDAVRRHPPPFWAMESLLKEYPIASAEGLALMRLAEALLRVPDAETAIALTADQLGRADFDGAPDSPLARLSQAAIALSKKLLPSGTEDPGLLSRLGARTVVAATLRAVQLLGRQFVLGQTIDEALKEAAGARRHLPKLRVPPPSRPEAQQPPQGAAQPEGQVWGLTYSYDMLGEGARTAAAADHYFENYRSAIATIARDARPGSSPFDNDGISIKLSALHPRYEDAQRERVLAELVPRVWLLCAQAAKADINLTIDAEEVDRLELSLDVFEALAQRVSREHPQWRGFGLALQSYQTRALELIAHVAALGRRLQLRFMCRLVKGAYWDAEIKRAQEMGLPHYPVFTHKHHTDISYLACARALFDAGDVIFPQFATHNAGTIAAILQLAQWSPHGASPLPPEGAEPALGRPGGGLSPHGASPLPPEGAEPALGRPGGGLVAPAFELQRLHGMGEGLYREVLQDRSLRCRVYAPVGQHRDLLAYLVRRLLENGANSSFVHQLADESVGMDQLLVSPLWLAPQPSLPLPPDLYGAQRRNSDGIDLTVAAMREPLLVAMHATQVPAIALFDVARIGNAVDRSLAAGAGWNGVPVGARSAILRRAADAMQEQLPRLCALLVKEAFKTWGDAVSEVREAVDFLRYYANEAERIMQPVPLAGPTGESNELRLTARGAWVCISPWNFPLAIFTGQVAAALATGNSVLAKPAEQTPAIANEAVKLLHDCGVPLEALQLLHGPGQTVGAALVAQPRIAGVVFTGSTQVARIIYRALAAKDGPIVPLIAETGGINAMLVDSTALPEQVTDAVVQSAFRSAGQRCSALRLLCLHEGIADAVIAMLRGAAQELVTGDPSLLATDVGPVIDREAYEGIRQQLERLHATAKDGTGPDPVSVQPGQFRIPGQARDDSHFFFIPPQIFEVAGIADVKQEIFGPVLQVVRWSGDPAAVIDQVNALGYGLTLGIQTRIDSRAQALAARADAGNVYINRNMIGAVVGVQPFGGDGLSGTGPKAGGPHYLQRFCAERTITVNTTAAGGNVALLS